MGTRTRLLWPAVFAGAVGTALSCQPQGQSPESTAATATDPGPLEGTWQEVEIVVTGANAVTIEKPQPSLYIFTPTHYAMLGTIGDQPRRLHETLAGTDAEKLDAYNTFWAHGGTYEVSGDTVTIRPSIARMPNFMSGGYLANRFRLAGDTLWLTGKSTDDHYRLGDQVVGDPRPFSEYRTKLVRVR